MIYLLIILYIIGGVLTYGLNFAYMQKEFPTLAKEHKNKDRIESIILGLLWPIGLFAIILMIIESDKFKEVFKHGLKF